DSTSQAEDQETRLLTIQNLIHSAVENSAQREALRTQIRTLMGNFEQSQMVLRQSYSTNTSDIAFAQIVTTLDDTNHQWASSRKLLIDFLSTTDETHLAAL